MINFFVFFISILGVINLSALDIAENNFHNEGEAEKGASCEFKNNKFVDNLKLFFPNVDEQMYLELLITAFDKGEIFKNQDTLSELFRVSAAKGFINVIEFLLEEARLNGIEIKHKNSIVGAVEQGQVDVTKLLLAMGADVNHEDVEGYSILMLAAKFGHLEIVKILIENGADINHLSKYDRTALMVATKSGHTEIVKILIENQAEVNFQSWFGKSALMRAAIYNYTDIVKILLKNGADINMQDESDRTALMLASLRGCNEVVKLLINSGADVNLVDNCKDTALINAAIHNHEEIVKSLIKDGQEIDINYRGFGGTAWHWAVCNKNRDLLEFLLENGLDINFQSDSIYFGSFYETVQLDDLDIVKLVLASGANIDERNQKGKTSLICSVNRNRKEMLEFLIANGANVNLQNNKGKTALMYSVEKSYFDNDMVEFLIANGADIDMQDASGETALMLAIDMKKKSIIKLLIRLGADLELKNNRGQSVLEKSQEQGFTKLSDMIVEYRENKKFKFA